jgi:hypothetical protein
LVSLEDIPSLDEPLLVKVSLRIVVVGVDPPVKYQA